MKHRLLGFAVVAAALSFSPALQAAPLGATGGARSAADAIDVTESVQFMFEGRRYCWYGGGWRGPGWYRCGFAWQRGLGWGGPQGWHGWNRGGPGPRRQYGEGTRQYDGPRGRPDMGRGPGPNRLGRDGSPGMRDGGGPGMRQGARQGAGPGMIGRGQGPATTGMGGGGPGMRQGTSQGAGPRGMTGGGQGPATTGIGGSDVGGGRGPGGGGPGR
jgi:hypothetical protein